MCWRQGAEGPWALDILSWCTRCSGDLDDGWVEVVLPKRFFRYLSPWQRSVRRWMWRGPHAEWPGSVFFNDAVTGCFC
jgi:hypothetical protein